MARTTAARSKAASRPSAPISTQKPRPPRSQQPRLPPALHPTRSSYSQKIFFPPPGIRSTILDTPAERAAATQCSLAVFSIRPEACMLATGVWPVTSGEARELREVNARAWREYTAWMGLAREENETSGAGAGAGARDVAGAASDSVAITTGEQYLSADESSDEEEMADYLDGSEYSSDDDDDDAYDAHDALTGDA